MQNSSIKNRLLLTFFSLFKSPTICLGRVLAIFMILPVLNACSIKNESVQDQKIKIDSEQTQVTPTTDEEYFIAECTKCLKGDISKLDEIIATYHSSFTGSTIYDPKEAFKYQTSRATIAYEKCAQKALALGNPIGMQNLLVKQGRIARTARFFYAQQNLTEGAYWLRRLVNVVGEEAAYEVAGRIFIQDIRTMSTGVRLLQQSARLGNRNARQLLFALLQPGSIYYQQITKNAPTETELSEEKVKTETIQSKNIKNRLKAYSDSSKNIDSSNISSIVSSQDQSSETNLASHDLINEQATGSSKLEEDTLASNKEHLKSLKQETNYNGDSFLRSTSVQLDSLDALNSNDPELNIDLDSYTSSDQDNNQVYNQEQSSSKDKLIDLRESNAKIQQQEALKQKQAPKSLSSDSNIILNRQEANRLEHNKRLAELQKKAEEAAQRAKERTARKIKEEKENKAKMLKNPHAKEDTLKLLEQNTQ